MRNNKTINRWSMAICLLATIALGTALPACGGPAKPAESPAPTIDPEEEGKKALTQAIEAEETGDYEAAEMHFLKAREQRPTHYETAERFTRFLLETKRDNAQAVSVAKGFLDDAPDALEGYLLLADAQLAAKELEAAQQTLSDLILLDESAAAYAKRGQVRVQQGSYEQGIEDIRKATELDPTNLDHQVALGDAWKESGDLDQSSETLEAVLTENPDHVGALLSYGAVVRDLGKPEQAFERHQKAVELDPGSARAHYELGISQFYLREGEQAEASLKRATELGPSDAQSWYVYGELLRNRQAYDEAADKYRRAREIDVDHDKASTKLGLMLIYIGDAGSLEEAGTVLQARIERHPEDAAAHFLLGEVYEKQEQFAEALAAYQKFLEVAERGNADVPQARRKVRQLRSKVR